MYSYLSHDKQFHSYLWQGGVSAILCVLAVSCSQPAKLDPGAAAQLLPSSTTVSQALVHLEREMDVFHQRAVVFDDLESGGELYVPSGHTNSPGERLRLTYPSEGAHEGATCLQVQWTPASADDWVAVAWQYPEGNWGDLPGRNLQGATQLRFWAKGKTGRENIQFKFGVVHDTARKHSDSCVPVVQRLRLSRDWCLYTMDLQGKDLSCIISGFCFAASALSNPNGCDFYLDEISLDQSRSEEPRLIRSYRVDRWTSPGGEHVEHLRNTCFIYDNALAICAFLSSPSEDHHRRAKLIADAMVKLSSIESDGHLRNAYSCGDLFTMSPSSPHTRVPRMPGRMNRGAADDPPMSAAPWIVDTYSMGADCGNMAWAMLSLLNVWDNDGRNPTSQYLCTAQRLGEWILDHASDSQPGAIGFYGGEEWDWQTERLKPVRWKSTEHNIDLAVAFARLADAASDARERNQWQNASNKALEFVRWAQLQGRDDGGRLITGTIDGTTEPAMTPKPLDPQTWSVVAFPTDMHRYEPALDWALQHCRVMRSDAWGVRFSADTGHDIWPEGTGQLALALRILGRVQEADDVLHQLEYIMTHATSSTAAPGGIPAAYPCVVETGFSKNKYYGMPHIGATAWYILACNSWNPYTGRYVQ